MMRRYILSLTSFFMLGACDQTSTSQVSPRELTGPVSSANKSVEENALSILSSRCESCHEAGVRPGMSFLNGGTHKEKLLAALEVVPGEPEASLLFQRITKGDMPPSPLARLNEADVETLRQWIISLKPKQVEKSATMTKEVVEKEAVAFLNSVQATDKGFYRFLVLEEAELSEEEMTIHHQALAKLINSLTWQASLIKPEYLAQGHIMVLDTRWFDNPAVWSLVRELYRDTNETIGFDIQSVKDLVQEALPIIQASWFIDHASKDKLYYALLNIPNTLKELEPKLGFSVTQNTQSGSAIRGGALVSGVSFFNRIIDRQETNFGSIWISYDFGRKDKTKKNALRFPIGPLSAYEGSALANSVTMFEHDGGEVIFHLPNGMFGYMLIDALGKVIVDAPTSVVQNKNRIDGVVRNGVDCHTCHSAGMIPIKDEIAGVRKDTSIETLEINKLYKGQALLDEKFKLDSEKFTNALAALGIDKLARDPIAVSIAMSQGQTLAP